MFRPEIGPPQTSVCARNYGSAKTFAKEVSAELRSMLDAHIISGPFDQETAVRLGFVTHPVGTVDKKGTAERRKVVDFGIILNWHTIPIECQLPKIDDAVRLVKRLGRNVRLIKIDL